LFILPNRVTFNRRAILAKCFSGYPWKMIQFFIHYYNQTLLVYNMSCVRVHTCLPLYVSEWVILPNKAALCWVIGKTLWKINENRHIIYNIYHYFISLGCPFYFYCENDEQLLMKVMDIEQNIYQTQKIQVLQQNIVIL